MKKLYFISPSSKKLIPIFFLLLASKVYSQKHIETYIKKQTVPIKTIESNSKDDSDLEAFGKAIGDSRIVMLGEQDHGDAPTFQAKERLIKYLHEKKGFNVLAFESDFYGLNYGWDELNKDSVSITHFLAANIFTIWTCCDICQNFFYNYIPATWKTKQPIIITGFDSQVSLDHSFHNLQRELDSELVALKIILPPYPIRDPVYDVENMANVLIMNVHKKNKDELKKMLLDTSTYNQRCRYLDDLHTKLLNKLPANNFWVKVVENLIVYNKGLWYYMEQLTDNYKNFALESNERDKQMALNLKWLAEVKFPNEKIIVWAHNYHVAKYGNYKPLHFFDYHYTMGRYFTEDTAMMRQTYVLGFTSYEGNAGRLGKHFYPLPRPKKQSLEKWVNESYHFAFIDFKGYNKLFVNNPESFFMSGSLLSRHEYRKAQWTKIFDGVFNVREMRPCEFKSIYAPKG